jgi:hypothetical protein
MKDPIAFARARLDDDEAAATNDGRLRGDTWTACEVSADRVTWDVMGTGRGLVAEALGWEARHIARHDPARVLVEVKTKREILRWHGTFHTVSDGFCYEEGGPCTGAGEAVCTICGQEPCDTVKLLLTPYADHPDYDEDWRP